MNFPKMNLFSLGVNDIAVENGTRKLDLRLETSHPDVGRGIMTWSLEVVSLTFSKKEQRFVGKARRKFDNDRDLDYTDLSIKIGDDGILVVDCDGARMFHFATPVAKTTSLIFSRSSWRSTAGKFNLFPTCTSTRVRPN